MDNFFAPAPSAGDLVVASKDLFEGPSVSGLKVCFSFPSEMEDAAIHRGQVGLVIEYLGVSECVSVIMDDLRVFAIPSFHLKVIRGLHDVA
jgi:hypothetical protein